MYPDSFRENRKGIPWTLFKCERSENIAHLRRDGYNFAAFLVLRAVEVVKHAGLLDFVLGAVPQLLKTAKQPYLWHVLAFELLCGKGRVSGGGAVRRMLMENRPKLEAPARVEQDRGTSREEAPLHNITKSVRNPQR